MSVAAVSVPLMTEHDLYAGWMQGLDTAPVEDLRREWFRRPEWMESGACRDAERSLFFPVRGAPIGPAKAICSTCPVRQACLNFALADPEIQGVWGGTSNRERQKLRTAGPPPARAKHLYRQVPRKVKPAKVCTVCGQKPTETAGRCKNCARYFRCHGVERPPVADLRVRGPRAKPWCTVCHVCPVLAKERCRNCYAFWKRTGKDRSNAEERQVEINRREMERRFELEAWGPGGMPQQGLETARM